MASGRSRSNGSRGVLAGAATILLLRWGWLSSAANGSAWLVVLVLLGIVAVAVWLARQPQPLRAEDPYSQRSRGAL